MSSDPVPGLWETLALAVTCSLTVRLEVALTSFQAVVPGIASCLYAAISEQLSAAGQLLSEFMICLSPQSIAVCRCGGGRKLREVQASPTLRGLSVQLCLSRRSLDCRLSPHYLSEDL